MARGKPLVVLALALVVALGSSGLAGDVAYGAAGEGRMSTSIAGANRSAATGGPVVSAAGASHPASASPPVASRTAAPRATTGTSAPASRSGSTQPSLEPVTVNAGAICDGATGQWGVYWQFISVLGEVVVTSVTDPLNGVAFSGPPEGQNRFSLWWQFHEYEAVPGSATVAALAMTLALEDGSSYVVNRTFQLGGPCIVQPAPPCDTSAVQIDVSAAGDRGSFSRSGPCGFEVAVTMPDPHNGPLQYSYGGVFGDTTTARLVFMFDLPPCHWVAVVTDEAYGPRYIPGGDGPCTDGKVTVVEECRNRFLLTLSNGADAALPTTFAIVWGYGDYGLPMEFHRLAPGQSVTVDTGPGMPVGSVMYWAATLTELTWQEPRGGKCSEVPPPTVPPGVARSSPSPVAGH